MPALNTSALVLRHADYADYDRMVTLFSPEYGRIDAVAETDKWVYLFEFKLNKDDSVLEQIKEKEYFKPYLLSNKRIMLVGVNFDTGTGKLSDWKDEEVVR